MIADINIGFENITNNDMILAAVGYTVVFMALVVLYFVFTLLSKILTRNIRKRLKEKGREIKEGADVSISGEVSAAISMALYLHFNEQHDEESGLLTIKKISRRYSPWSSKIYGVMYNRLQK